MIADGSYGKLLAKWKLSPNALEKATINAGQ
jgi:polar amino acid transport system substrate-binding protein